MAKELRGLYGEEIDTSVEKVFRANLLAAFYYKPQTYPGSAVLLRASKQAIEVKQDTNLGWNSLIRGGIQAHTISGDHYSIMREPQVKYLAEKLNNHLKLIQSKQDREL